jgi:hypothetical protein
MVINSLGFCCYQLSLGSCVEDGMKFVMHHKLSKLDP